MKQHDNNESSIQNESLTDLPLTGEQADETKAGTGTHGTGGGGGAGKVSMNDFHFVMR
ncbi:MAG TPA: hypothetical protein VLD57_10760 [Blastocatellia bacterium]|nr:hypothetical protein [Blastocatellia bacterium]